MGVCGCMCVCLCGRRVLFGQCAEASKSEKTKSETKDQLEVVEAPKVVEAQVLVVIVTTQIPRSRRPESLMPQPFKS